MKAAKLSLLSLLIVTASTGVEASDDEPARQADLTLQAELIKETFHVWLGEQNETHPDLEKLIEDILGVADGVVCLDAYGWAPLDRLEPRMFQPTFGTRGVAISSVTHVSPGAGILGPQQLMYKAARIEVSRESCSVDSEGSQAWVQVGVERPAGAAGGDWVEWASPIPVGKGE